MRELFFKCIDAILVLYRRSHGRSAKATPPCAAYRCWRISALFGRSAGRPSFPLRPNGESSLRHGKMPGCRRCRFIFRSRLRLQPSRQSWTMRFAALNGRLPGRDAGGKSACCCAALEGLGGCPAQEEEQRLAYAQTAGNRFGCCQAEAAQQRRLYRTLGLSLGGAAALLLL